MPLLTSLVTFYQHFCKSFFQKLGPWNNLRSWKEQQILSHILKLLLYDLWHCFLFRIVFFLAVALTSSALIIERMEGLLDRSWVAGMFHLPIPLLQLLNFLNNIHRCNTRRSSLFPRSNSICSYVRTNCFSVDLHDSRFWSGM